MFNETFVKFESLIWSNC